MLRTRTQRDPSASRVGPSHLLAAAAILGLLVMPVAFAADGNPAAVKSASVTKQIKSLKKQVATLSSRLAAVEARPDQVGQVPASLPPSGLAGGALTGTYPSPLIADGAVRSAQIADGSITGADLTPNAIGSGQIADGSITGADIAPNTIGSAQVADNSITGADIAPNTIGVSRIGGGGVFLNYGAVAGSSCTSTTGVISGYSSSRGDLVLITPLPGFPNTFTLEVHPVSGADNQVGYVVCNTFTGGGSVDPDGVSGGLYPLLVIKNA